MRGNSSDIWLMITVCNMIETKMKEFERRRELRLLTLPAQKTQQNVKTVIKTQKTIQLISRGNSIMLLVDIIGIMMYSKDSYDFK